MPGNRDGDGGDAVTGGETMNLNEFVRTQINQMLVAAAETTAAMTDNPDDAASVPLVFFRIEEKLLATWQTEYERLLAPPEEKR